MRKRYVITLTAANRVGILAALTTALDELGGDLEEVTQTVIQGYFALILAANFPEERSQHVIVEHVRDVCRPYGVEVCLKDPDFECGLEPIVGDLRRFYLTLTGENRPGVVRMVSSRLAQDGIDIVNFSAVCHDGGRSFVISMELDVPADVDARLLQNDLEELGEPVSLSATMQPEDVFAPVYSRRATRSLTQGRPVRPEQ